MGTRMKYLKWLLSFTSRTANLAFVAMLLISLSASYISPNEIWFLPFWGLLLPLFIFINLVFVLIWVLRRRYFAIVSLLAVGASFPQLFRLGATNILKKGAEHQAAASIRVMSYNVRDFDLYNWSENAHSKEEIFRTIKESHPDVICFQEFYNDTSIEFNTIRQLQNLGYKYYMFTRELVLRNTDEWGIALFSKLPIEDQGALMKQTFNTGYGKKPFKGLYADVKVGDSIVRIVNVHLQSIYFGTQDYETIEEFRATQNLDEFGARSILVKLKKAFKRRAQQADELRAFLDVQTKPLIVCGDFNDVPNSYAANKISKGMKDAFLDHSFGIGHTYNGKLPFLRIDYILCSPVLDVREFHVLPNKISDHYPVLAGISLPAR